MKTLIAGAPGDIVDALTLLCAERGCELAYAEDMEGLTAFAENGDADLACIAHYLQDGTSFEACKRLREFPQWQHCPIVFVMDRPSHAVIEKAFASGFSETFDLNHAEELRNFLSHFDLAEIKQQGRVLVVEDSLSQQKLVTSVLVERGLEVSCCLDAESAEKMIREQNFDLLISDIVLEGDKTGLDLISRVRRMPEGKGDIPIIVMSSYKDVSQKIGPFRIGADDYIAKPLDLEELLARSNRLLKARRLMLKVKEQQQKLEQTNQCMTQMLGRVSHECRNSINIVMGISKMVLKREDMRDTLRAKIETIVNASRHQLSLLDDILDYTKLESGNIEVDISDVDLLNLLDEVTSLFRYKCEEMGLLLEVEVGDGLPRFLPLDERLVKQVLINLINNAVKFTEQGFVRVSIYANENREMIFSVTDSGPGVPKHEQNLLFEEFKQTSVGKNKKSSSGLGLSLCRGFAKVMGGRMEVESEEGKGSVFSLVVPAAGLSH